MLFTNYGLNKYRNFMALKDNNSLIELNGDDVFCFCNEILNSVECDNPGIFLHFRNGEMSACIRNTDFEDEEEYSLDFDNDFYRKYGMLRWNIANPKEYFDDDYQEEIDPENFQIEILSIPETDMDFFSCVDGDYRLCCYSILVEIQPGKWKLITE